MTRVACERPDGVLNIHDEAETCEVCKDVVIEDIGEPGGAADTMRQMFEEGFRAAPLRSLSDYVTPEQIERAWQELLTKKELADAVAANADDYKRRHGR